MGCCLYGTIKSILIVLKKQAKHIHIDSLY